MPLSPFKPNLNVNDNQYRAIEHNFVHPIGAPKAKNDQLLQKLTTYGIKITEPFPDPNKNPKAWAKHCLYEATFDERCKHSKKEKRGCVIS